MRPSFYMLQKELIEHKTVTRVPLFILLCGVLLFLSLMMNANLQDNLFISVQTQAILRLFLLNSQTMCNSC